MGPILWRNLDRYGNESTAVPRQSQYVHLPTELQLASLFFEGSPGVLAMLYRCYLDESSDGQQQEVFVAAARITKPRRMPSSCSTACSAAGCCW
jgi:hypothetical protein